MSSSHLKYFEVCDTACMHFGISLCTDKKKRKKVTALHVSTVLVCACVYLPYSRSIYLYLYIFLLLLANIETLKLNWSKHQLTHAHTHTPTLLSLSDTHTHTQVILLWIKSLCIYRNKINWLKECRQKTHKFSIPNIYIFVCVYVCVCVCVCVLCCVVLCCVVLCCVVFVFVCRHQNRCIKIFKYIYVWQCMVKKKAYILSTCIQCNTDKQLAQKSSHSHWN